MQPKKIITLFLAVILTCFLAVSIFAVEDDPLTIAVEVSSSTAISAKSDLCVKAGDEIKVKVTVETTPANISFYQFKINFDSKAFTLKTESGEVAYTKGAAANGNDLYVKNPSAGVVSCFTFGDKGYLATGDLITLTFTANSNYDGATKFDFVTVDFCKPNGDSVVPSVKAGAMVQLHKFGEPVVVGGNCVTNASTTYTCSVCDYKFATETAAVGAHKFEDMITNNLKYQASPADCVNPAKFYYSCSACGEKGTETFTFGSALGHKEVVDAGTPATCTTAGKSDGKHCSVCNTVTVAQTEIKALGHKEVVDAAVAATCTTGGKTEGKHCSVCNTIIMMQGDIPALGHKFDKENATDAFKVTDATCTDKATFYKSCSVCGAKGTETFASGDLAAHAAEDLVKVDAVEPTCTETGLTEGEMCSKCNATTKAQETVAAKGHVAGDWVVETEPKIGKEGKQYKACTVCSSIVETEAIPAKSALPIILVIVAVVLVGGGVGVFFVLKNKKEN